MMELGVPEGRLFVVEYPGYVANEERVLQSLGGLDRIAAQVQDSSEGLQLKFRPEDPYSHAIYGDKSKTNSLLVKLTRRVRRQQGRESAAAAAPSSSAQQQQQQQGPREAEGHGEQFTAEAVAVVQTVYRFTSPADYQYVGLDTRPGATAPLEASGDKDPPGFAPQPLLCSPPLFAKQPVFDYGFRGFVSSAPAVEAGGTTRRRQGGTMVSFFAPDAPAPLPQPLQVPDDKQPLLESLQGLFARRPVWVMGALEEELAPEATRAQAEELLPKLCYRFRNGPWKHAWVRRGFDPRCDPRARAYQSIEYHLPVEWHAKISDHLKSLKTRQQAAGAGGEEGAEDAAAAAAAAAVMPPIASAYSQLLRFEAVPERQGVYLPVCFIRDTPVQLLLQDPANHTQHCSDASGWLTTAAWEGIRRRVKERFGAILEGRPLPPDNDLELPDVDGFEFWEEGTQQQQAQQQQQQAQQQGEAGGSGAAAAGGAAAQLQQLRLGEGGTEDAARQAATAEAAAPAAAAAPRAADVEMLDPDTRGQQPQHAASPSAAAGPAGRQPAAAAAGLGPAGGEGGELPLLPQGMLASVQDYLAHMPELDAGDEYEILEDEEEEEEGGGLGAGVAFGAGGEYQTEDEGGYQTEEGGYHTEEGEGGYHTDELGAAGTDEEDE